MTNLYRAAVFAVLALTTTGSATASDVTSTPIPASYFGMSTAQYTQWPAVPIGALGKANGHAWLYREPERGLFEWPGIDNYLGAAEAHHVDFVFTFLGTPQWASSRPTEHCTNGNIGCAAPPADLRDWDNFVTALVTRYKGRIQYYELWNEPNTAQFWSGSYADLVTLAEHAYRIIKSIDPAAQVVTPAPAAAMGYQSRASSSTGVPAEWMRNYLRAGGSNYADIGSFHGYLEPSDTTAYRMPEDSASPCRDRSWNPGHYCSGSIIDQVDRFRRVLDENGMAGKPLWDTEGGWGNGSITDPDLQAAFVARWLLLQWSEGVARTYWYEWGVNPKGLNTWGVLWTPAGGVNPGGVAYGEVYKWMVGATLSRRCAEGSHDTWTCGFTRPRGYQALAVWNKRGDVTYTPGPVYKRYRDLAGHASSLSGPLTVGIKPVLLESSEPPGS